MLVTEMIDLSKAPAKLKEIVDKFGPVEETVLIRKSFALTDDKKFEFKEGERAAVRYVSTIHLDRDNEIMLPQGAVLSEFRQAPQVLWGHDGKKPPIGSDQWIKADEVGILAKTIYAETERGEEVWQLVKAKHLRTSSVGFVPIKSVRTGQDGFDKLMDKVQEQFDRNGLRLNRDNVTRVYTKWLLLEHSDVSVPANINALTVAVAKGLKMSKDLLDEIGINPEQLRQEEEQLQANVDILFPDLDENIQRDREKLIDLEWAEECEKTGSIWIELADVLKPFPNEHACRLHPPASYSRFRRRNDAFGAGIHAIFGRRKTDGKSELQSIRFSKNRLTAAQAKKWAKDHNHTCSPFEAATGEASLCIIEEVKEPIIIEEVIEQKKDEILIIEEVEKEIGRQRGRV